MIGIVHDTAESRHLALIESVAQGRVPTKDIEDVSSSWQRCASELLINPESQAGPHIATESELRIFREPLTRAIISSQEEIDRLFATVRQEGYVVLLCNSEGVAIHHRGYEARDEKFKKLGIWLGGMWSEQIEGTNGIGTGIAEQRPVLIHGEQHFRTRYIDLSCATAPIFDRKGKITLALNCCTVRRGPAQRLALAAAKVAAHAVEERLFREFFGTCGQSRPCRLIAAVRLCFWPLTVICGSLALTGRRECYSVSVMIVSMAVCLYQPSSTTIGLPFDATRKRISQHASAVRMLRSGMY